MKFKHFLAENKHDFSSTQVNLPVNLSNEILSWGYKNLPEDIIFNNFEDNFYGREKNIHVTILYGIHTTKFNLVSSFLEDQTIFECTLQNISLFTDNSSFDVLKIDVNSEELHKINSFLKKKLTVTSTHSEYIPHVTIAYLKKRKGNKFLNNSIFKDKKFLVKEILFSSKDGKKQKIQLKDKK